VVLIKVKVRLEPEKALGVKCSLVDVINEMYEINLVDKKYYGGNINAIYN